MPTSASLRQLLPKDKTLLLFILAAIAGLAGGFSTFLFRVLLTVIQRAFHNDASSVVALAEMLPWWGRLMLPAAGGALAGTLLHFGLHWVPRRGADDYLEAITIGDGVLSSRQTLVKSFASLCSISSGASIGREGPMVQLSAMIASGLGRLLKLPRGRLRLLVACGVTSGIASAYNAPIAGCLFVAEIAMGSLSKATLGPLIVASVMANVVTRWFFGLDAVYQMPHFTLISGWEVFAYAGLGIVCGFLAPVFRWMMDVVRKVFLRSKLGLIATMTLGGFAVGVLSISMPEVWGNGYSVVNSILHVPWAWQTLALLLVMKVFATAISAGSGAVGGIFTPTLFVGAALGALYGHILIGTTLLSDTPVAGYAIVGMGAFLASVTYAPLMSIIMIFEMTLSYEVVLPLMLACVIGHYIAHKFRPDSIYRK